MRIVGRAAIGQVRFAQALCENEAHGKRGKVGRTWCVRPRGSVDGQGGANVSPKMVLAEVDTEAFESQPRMWSEAGSYVIHCPFEVSTSHPMESWMGLSPSS